MGHNGLTGGPAGIGKGDANRTHLSETERCRMLMDWPSTPPKVGPPELPLLTGGCIRTEVVIGAGADNPLAPAVPRTTAGEYVKFPPRPSLHIHRKHPAPSRCGRFGASLATGEVTPPTIDLDQCQLVRGSVPITLAG